MEYRGGKLWEVMVPDRGMVEEVSRKHGLTRLTARILVNRDITDERGVEQFLYPSLSHLSDPAKMADADGAARRIVEACLEGEKILIYADYDVDGATGAALLYLFLKELFPHVIVEVHHNDRIVDGYGMKGEYIKEASHRGFSLLITVDCGISNADEVTLARSEGMDVIITDHHAVKGEIPTALAVLNPKRKDCPFPFKGLAGVGVVFVLVCTIRKMLREMGFFSSREEPNLVKYLDLVALGTVADIVPLVEDNRIFVKFGLEQIRKNPRPGIRALLEASGVKRDFLNEVDLGFRLGPRINAAGRIGDSALSSSVLIERYYEKAIEMARVLSLHNTKRQGEEEKILKEAREIVEREGIDGKRVIVVGNMGWHVGVIGIVASRLLDVYGLPALVFSVEGGVAKGSARSTSRVNILELIEKCAPLVEEYGGHSQAAGLVVKREKMEEFSRAIESVATCSIHEEDLVRKVVIDGEVPLHDMSEKFFEELNLLAPFGPGNPEPVFLARNVQLFSVKRRRRFTSFNVSQGNVNFEAFFFGQGNGELGDTKVDLVFSPRVDMKRKPGKGRLFAREIGHT